MTTEALRIAGLVLAIADLTVITVCYMTAKFKERKEHNGKRKNYRPEDGRQG